MKALHNIIEILSVNFLSTIAIVLVWLNTLTGILTVIVLVSTLVYNSIKIFQALRNKNNKKGNSN